MNMKKRLALACATLALITAGTSLAADNTGTGGVITYTDSSGLNPHQYTLCQRLCGPYV